MGKRSEEVIDLGKMLRWLTPRRVSRAIGEAEVKSGSEREGRGLGNSTYSQPLCGIT